MADPTQAPGFWENVAASFRGDPIPDPTPKPAPTPPSAPGNYMQLSDGSFLNVPQGATPEAVRSATQQAEGVIDAQYRKQAADTNAPVYPGGTKVYSASHTYEGDTPVTRGMAWADHNLGGNWLNTHIADPLNKATTVGGVELGPAAMRVGTTVYTGVPDLAVAGINAGRHYVGAKGPDLPMPGPDIRASMGFPEISADAPFIQRALEAAATHRAASGLPSGVGDVARSVALGTGGTVGADVGQAAGGEIGSLIGGVVGGGGVPVRRPITDLIARTASEDAPQLYQDAQGLGFQPSYRMLSEPGGYGQRIANVLAAIPLFGSPIARANEVVREGLRTARNNLGEQVAGGPIPPDSNIGENLTMGARQAIPGVQARMDALYGPVNDATRFSSVDIQPIIQQMNAELGRQPVSSPDEAAIRATVQRMADWAPGGNRFVGPMQPNAPAPGTPGVPAPVPYSVVGSERSQLKRQLGPGEVRAPDDWIARIKDWQTEGMRQAADQAMPGGGQAFDTARRNYAYMKQNVLNRLYQMAGRPVGRNTGQFDENPPEARVANQFTGNLKSPNQLELLANPNTFSPDYWRQVVGQWIQGLGENRAEGYRPEAIGENLSRRRVEPQSLDLMVGANTPERQALDALARTAPRYSTPQSRHGLLETAGSAGAVHHVLSGIGGVAGGLLGGIPGAVGGSLIPGGVVYGLSRLFENPNVKRAMAGLPTTLPSYTDAIPNVAATVTQQQAQHPYNEVTR